MSDQPAMGQPGDSGGASFFQNFQHTPVGARVPEKIGRGVFATAIMVLQTNDLFIVDFLAMSAQPQQIVARIIMTAPNFSQFLAALRHNVSHYEKELGPLKPRFTPPQTASQSHGAAGTAAPQAEATGSHPGEVRGEMPVEAAVPGGMPRPASFGSVHDTLPHSPPSPPPITDLYEQVKFPEDLLGGTFANAVMIRHTPEDFCFDFISNLYPRPIVVSRVFAAAGRIPAFIEAISGSLGRFEHGGSPGV